MIRRVIIEWDDSTNEINPWHIYRKDDDGFSYGEIRVPTLRDAAAAAEMLIWPMPTQVVP